MATVLISLVGGRPLPNILLTLHLNPDHLYLIASQDSIGPGRDYEKTLAALPERLRPAEQLTVRPYRLQDTIAHCREIIDRHKDDTIIVNTTLGPKTMAFGAYDVAKELRLKGVQVEVCYLAREGLVCLFDDSIEAVKIGLEDYFSSYGWIVHWNDDSAADRLKHLAQVLVERLPVSHQLLRVLRSNDGGKGKRTRTAKQRFGDDEYALLQEIEALGFISHAQRDEQRTSWTINSDEDGMLLLSGGWLEFYVYQKAIGLTNQKGEKLFDECGWGVEDAGGKGEIDFAGIFQGQVVIASCKTEDTVKRVWFEELHSKMEQLGKGMCSGLLVSTVSRHTRTEKDLEDYRRWARERQIVLVLAEDLPNLPAILHKVLAADEKAEPKDIPIYPRI